jgi:hypothetical protein
MNELLETKKNILKSKNILKIILKCEVGIEIILVGWWMREKNKILNLFKVFYLLEMS